MNVVNEMQGLISYYIIIVNLNCLKEQWSLVLLLVAFSPLVGFLISL